MDSEIVRRLLQGEEAGMTLLRQRYGGLIDYVVGGILPDTRDREECRSDVELQAWQKIGSFDPNRGSFSAWLTAIFRNAAVSRLRRQRQEVPLDAAELQAPSAEEAVLRKEREARLQAALRSLPQEQRRLFLRKYYYLQSTAQIAAELGLSERAVEGKLYRLRKKLQRLLGGVL